MYKYNVELAKQVEAMMQALRCYYRFSEDDGLFFFSMKRERAQSEFGSFRCCIRVLEENNFLTYVYAPFYAKQKKDRVGEFLHRANNELQNGHFEMDFDDGEIWYKVYCEDDKLPNIDRIHMVLFKAFMEMDYYLPGIAQILFSDGGKDLKKVLRDCRKRVLQELSSKLTIEDDDLDADDDDDPDDDDTFEGEKSALEEFMDYFFSSDDADDEPLDAVFHGKDEE